MSSVLTDLVRQMGPGSEPSLELFDQSWDALRAMLAAQMKRRSTWSAPPRFLGIVGHASWVTRSREPDALDELTAQCFEFIFVRRLAALRDQATRKPNVDGLVALAIRHFLLEVQQRNDPLGFRIFEVLRRVVRWALSEDRLILVAGDTRVRNDSWLSRPDQAESASANSTPENPASNLESLADRWIGDHLDGLIGAAYGELSRLCERLADELLEFLEQESGAFRFGDLASLLKERGRSAWAARYLGPPFSTQSSEEPQRFEGFGQIADCVERGVDQFKGRAKTRRHLRRLWELIKSFSGDSSAGLIGEMEHNVEWTDEERLPSNRRLSQLLNIPREAIPGLMQALRLFWTECRQDPNAFGGVEGMSSSAPTNSASGRKTQSSARARAFEALKKEAAQESNDIVSEQKRPELGDICIFEGAEVDGVQWLFVSSDEGGVLAVPIDGCPLLGPRDRGLEIAALGGERSLRLKRGIRRREWPKALRMACLAEEELELLKEGPKLDGRATVDPSFPAYEDWMQDGPERARRRLLASLDDSEPAVPFPTGKVEASRATRSPWPALAALFAVVVFGLGVRLTTLERTVTQLSKPTVDIPEAEIKFNFIPRGPSRLTIPEGAEYVQIFFILSGSSELELFRIALIDEGSEIFTTGLRKSASELSWMFPIESLPEPPWEFHLQVRENDQWRTLDHELIEELVLEKTP